MSIVEEKIAFEQALLRLMGLESMGAGIEKIELTVSANDCPSAVVYFNRIAGEPNSTGEKFYFVSA